MTVGRSIGPARWLAAVVGVFLLFSTGPAAASAAPVVSSISPNGGPATGGTMVTITGTSFASGATVKFGATASSYVVYQSATKLLARSPAGTGGSTVDVQVTTTGGTSAAVAEDQFAYNSSPAESWLGLNANSGNQFGYRFEQHHILYDRSWQLEVYPGAKPEPGTWLGEGLEHSLGHGMKPIVTIEYSGSGIPTGTAKTEYVSGFITTVKAVKEKYPSVEVLYEPINEPWFLEKSTSGTAGRYAELISALLTSAEANGIALNTIYVGAWGFKGSEQWIPTMYATDSSLKKKIKGWYVHPYGRPGLGANPDINHGIMAVQTLREEMTSGQNNVIVSEVGFWTPDVNGGANKTADEYSWTNNSTEAAELLTRVLDEGRAMHQEGWLKALLVYSREQGGWAMTVAGALTGEGQALVNFADYVAKPHVFSLAAGSFGSGPGQFGKPWDVATDSAGNVWAIDLSHSRIEKFSPSGTYLAEIALGFNGESIAVSPLNGHIYVVDRPNAQIKEYETSGTLVRTIGGTSSMSAPEDMAIDSEGNIWVSDLTKNAIFGWKPDGTLLRTIGVEAAPQPLAEMESLAVSGSTLYVADPGTYGEDRIVKFSTGGEYLGQIGASAWSYGGFTTDTGLAVNPVTGNLYMNTSSKVLVFSPEGSYLTSFGESGSGEGQFAFAHDLAFGPSQSLWVADSNHSRLQKWVPAP